MCRILIDLQQIDVSHVQSVYPDRVRLGLRLEGGVGSAITTLDKKACEGFVW